MSVKKSLKLNLGCGSMKLDGYVNIDVERACKPDLLLNFTKDPLPYKPKSVDEIVLFHTIEHIPKKLHIPFFEECFRVLKPNAPFILSYPEFLKCVENWKKNTKGLRDFWESTIYGRQLYPSDYHVSLMDSERLSFILRACGFVDIKYQPEPKETFNSVMFAKRGQFDPISQEELTKKDMERFKISNPRQLKVA